jgi:hypothetical protein
MDVNALADLLDRPETHQKVLGSYRGPYSLGVTRSPVPEGSPGFLLRVEDKDPKTFPKSVSIDGHEIPVVVRGGFTAPLPQ